MDFGRCVYLVWIGGRSGGEGVEVVEGSMWVNGGVNRLVLSKWIWGGVRDVWDGVFWLNNDFVLSK